MIRYTTNRRRGAILPLVALCLIAMFAMVALAIDLGLVALARNQAQNAADTAALTGARQLNGDGTNNNNFAAAAPAAKTQAAANFVLGTAIAASNVTIDVGYYAYDSIAQKFNPVFTGTKPTGENWSSVKATVTSTQPTFFAKVINFNAFTANATATAVHRPRDISIVLDFSGSMRYSCQTAWPSSGDYSGSLNPDQVIPRFGPWAQLTASMQRTNLYVDGGGETHAPNNLTMETDNGPAIVKDFLYRDSGGNLQNAFHRTFDAATWLCPAPADWDVQSSLSQPYVGDLWPRINRIATNGYAKTVSEYVNLGAGTTPTAVSVGSTSAHAKSALPGGGSGPFDPVNHNAPTTQEGYGPNFKGYSMGPGYYGKSFYLWPPDPRWKPGTTAADKDLQKDWRKKFFFNNGTTTPLGGNSTSTTADNRADNSLLWDTSGFWRQSGTGAYSINYDAVLEWIKAGPQTLPSNLRAGRVLYYSAIPDTIPSSGLSLDQQFWKSYIDYVIGSGDLNFKQRTLYGMPASMPTGWGSMKITAKASLAAEWTGSPASQTGPFMQYTDNPVPPRLHFWFGPLSMLSFVADDNSTLNRNWMPGTCHEAQCWQLKAGIQSALDDIQKNHPNDWCAMLFFSGLQAYTTPRVAMGRDYVTMKNVLFYPFSLRNSLSDPNAEVRPYNSGMNDISQGEVPNAAGSTSPECGFKMSYNQFSSASGFNGRKGAMKMVIFETDGVPNTRTTGSLVNGGAYNSYYSGLTLGANVGNNDSTVVSTALSTVTQLCALDTANPPGYSTLKLPARVHAIGFGDLFQSGSQAETDARTFLLNVQKNGKTSATGDTGIESYKIIIGDYQTRIDNLKNAMERIMQSGIQVTLIR